MSAGVWIAVAVAVQVGGLTALRASDGLRRPVLAVGAYAGLIGSLLPVARAIESGMTLAVAYSIWTGAGIALGALTGALVFGDRLSRQQIAGLALIMLGVVALEAGGR